MSYTTDDFAETMRRVPIDLKRIRKVEAAWGHGTGQGTDAGGYGWAPTGASDWSGGFLLRYDGGFIYVSGWCDYTGWGCQDGVSIRLIDEPHMTTPQAIRIVSRTNTGQPIENIAPENKWDIDPPDLNRWLLAEAGGPLIGRHG